MNMFRMPMHITAIRAASFVGVEPVGDILISQAAGLCRLFRVGKHGHPDGHHFVTEQIEIFHQWVVRRPSAN
jgi:hypothetical protein